MAAKIIILIAEDDENDVFLMSRALQKIAIPVTTHFVTDGQSAIDYLAGHGKYADRQLYPLPHFAFFDIKMPRRTGLEALEWTREQPQFKHLPLMIISASAEERDIKLAHKLGVSAYVVKPSDQDLLTSELKRFFDFWGPQLGHAFWSSIRGSDSSQNS